MKNFLIKRAFWVSLVFVFAFGLLPFEAAAQSSPKPLFQTITVQAGKKRPRTTPTPLVTRTSSTKPIVSSRPVKPTSSLRKTSFPALAAVQIPGYSGVLVEHESGRVVIDSYSRHTFNPASNVKVATAYAVLKTFGVNYRFKTGIWTDGTINRSTRTLVGNLYISGRDPMFNYEHAVSLANELNRLGINKIEGDLITTDNFAMNFSNSASRSANLLLKTLSAAKRSRAASKAWSSYLSNSGKYNATNNLPSVFINGDSYVEGLPSNVKMLFTHESAPLREIVKATMSFSNNFLSERLGGMLGGAYAVARIVQRDTRSAPFEFQLQTCSGLGINRVSPKAQMRLLRTFKSFLNRNRMKFSDVMPVAGLDNGTLKRRFNEGLERGSVVGKTGTLGRTDRGVSTLSGEITTRQGKFLFVIFNQRGSVRRFRSFQNYFVPLVQNQLGGALPMRYIYVPMERRLAKSRISYPRGNRFRGEE
ncbi:MAG: hypothetical protein HKN25_03405 [Pyrinomonadaceae bacterium]|nr:hypothetical protein [Pyrinomonadaceae bacterium]